MKISQHADRTEQLFGVRGEDIHRWIDGFFDYNGQDHAQLMAKDLDYDPYDHRRFRHCKEALGEAYREFGGRYTQQQIKDVFETHIRDDYDGYLPLRADFDNGTFTAKYHERTHADAAEDVLDESELADYFEGLHHHTPNDPKRITQFSYRVVLPTVSAIVLFITAIVYVIVPLVESSMIDQKRQMLKELTSAAASIVEGYVVLEQQGVLSLAQAQQRAAMEIKTMRYGAENKDYFFITDFQPRMVMHPYLDELIGEDLTFYGSEGDSKTPSIFVDIVETVQRDQQGFLEYQWQWKDDPTLTAPKMTYVEGVEQWSWIIGTGVYIEDVEQSVAKLENALSRIFIVITIGLIAIMSYVLAQSRRSEVKKKRAEQALHEAKNRYRALVESSNEGYILEVDGKIIFSNNRLHQMLGYQAADFQRHDIWQLLFSEEPRNTKVIQHLLLLFEQQVDPNEFEAQLRTVQGRTIDIILSTSKIFLSQKLGHVVTFRPIVRKVYGNNPSNVAKLDGIQNVNQSIVEQIGQASNSADVIESLNLLADEIRSKISSGTRPENLRQLIGRTYDAAICRFIELTIEQIGPAPVPFSFISFGSNARHDMTLFSDQDNALVFDAPEGTNLKATRRYFLHLAEKVCALLDQAGYRYCEGLIMASNHQWCLNVQEWKDNFEYWITNATAESILELNVFFDIRSTYGDDRLVSQIQSFIQQQLSNHSTFLPIYTSHCHGYDVPLDNQNQLITELHDGKPSINLKDCLRPIETVCRLTALKFNINEVSTVARLRALHKAQKLDSMELREWLYCFDHIWHLRFINQLVEYTDLRKVNDVLAIEELSVLERNNLINVLERIAILQSKLLNIKSVTT